jgi:hypothetical protein
VDWTIEISHDPDLIRIKAAGLATVAECERMVNDVLSRDFWQSGTPLLINCLKVDVRELRYDDVDRSGQILQRHSDDFGHCRIAIISRPGFGYGVSRQFKVLTELKTKINVEIFYNEADAVAWLSDISHPTVSGNHFLNSN